MGSERGSVRANCNEMTEVIQHSVSIVAEAQ